MSPIMQLRPVVVADVELNAEKFEARYRGRRLRLTLTEFRLLHSLLKRAGFVCTRKDLLRAISVGLGLIDRNIDVHVSNLRRKLLEGGQRIETIRGLGYRFNDELV